LDQISGYGLVDGQNLGSTIIDTKSSNFQLFT